MCGAISQYAHATDPSKQYHFKNIIPMGFKRIRMEGFVILDHSERFEDIYQQLAKWQAQGKLVPRSHILEGLEQAPTGLQMILEGKNNGKMLVAVAQD